MHHDSINSRITGGENQNRNSECPFDSISLTEQHTIRRKKGRHAAPKISQLKVLSCFFQYIKTNTANSNSHHRESVRRKMHSANVLGFCTMNWVLLRLMVKVLVHFDKFPRKHAGPHWFIDFHGWVESGSESVQLTEKIGQTEFLPNAFNPKSNARDTGTTCLPLTISSENQPNSDT